MMDMRDVLWVLGLAGEAGCEVWVAGGWGIDALVGRVTREHRDLDLLHRAEQEPVLVETLTAAGFVEQDDAVPGRPVRFVMRDRRGRELDLHPLGFAKDGSAVQAADDGGGVFRYPADAFATGVIDAVAVKCLSAEQQVAFHQHYEPREQDLQDMALLREAFGIATHF